MTLPRYITISISPPPFPVVTIAGPLRTRKPVRRAKRIRCKAFDDPLSNILRESTTTNDYLVSSFFSKRKTGSNQKMDYTIYLCVWSILYMHRIYKTIFSHHFSLLQNILYVTLLHILHICICISVQSDDCLLHSINTFFFSSFQSSTKITNIRILK